jgi:hypothetical protein
MHEERLVRDLRAKVDELSRAHGGARLLRARVALGPLAHLDAERFRRLWERTMAGGPAEATVLEVETIERLDDPGAASIVLRTVTFEEAPASAGASGSSVPEA